MTSSIDRLIEVVEDRTAMELAFRIILEATESKQLPPEGNLPVFHDQIVNCNFFTILERVTGKSY